MPRTGGEVIHQLLRDLPVFPESEGAPDDSSNSGSQTGDVTLFSVGDERLRHEPLNSYHTFFRWALPCGSIAACSNDDSSSCSIRQCRFQMPLVMGGYGISA